MTKREAPDKLRAISFARYCVCGKYLEARGTPAYSSAELARIFRAHMREGCEACDRETMRAHLKKSGKKRHVICNLFRSPEARTLFSRGEEALASVLSSGVDPVEMALSPHMLEHVQDDEWARGFIMALVERLALDPSCIKTLPIDPYHLGVRCYGRPPLERA